MPKFACFGQITETASPVCPLTEKHAMVPIHARRGQLRSSTAGCVCLMAAAVLYGSNASADPAVPGAIALPTPQAEEGSSPATDILPAVFTRASALGWALQNNPDLAALRQQHGIA